ncbi:spherulation-specific family 4 protein [Actinocorallia sp. B10E7]|uniref:spherulation-specific family 4 protein n=1 Tax=Actinocorallia sp. B10E7 TaxID=3153558 RepID=UPI00325F3F46
MSTAAVVPAAAARPRPVPDSALVPAYFHPEVAPEDWRRLADPRLYAVVLNIDSGPGRAPDPAFRSVVRRIEENGGTVAAYVDVGYARRDPALVVEDLRRYRDWYEIADVFFDQAPAAPDALPYMRAVTATARAQGADLVVLNHGVYPDPAYAALADVLVTFEGPAETYLTLTPPSWPRSHPRHGFCHLVHTCPPDLLDQVLALARRHHTGLVYATDRSTPNPYDRLPPYHPRLLTLASP